MSELSRAVTDRLKGAVPEQEVEDILREARVTTAAAVPTPVRLRVLEVAFSGAKRLEPAHRDGAGDTVTAQPFEFSWSLGPGLYVVGSHENLRGKTSVLEVIRWALRGRCRLQEDVQSWLQHVRVVFLVGQERLVVEFAVRNGQPVGAVHRDLGASSVELVRFDTEDSFEQAMNSVMMTRLHLQRIAAWQHDQAIEHAWVAYAGALSISSRGLDYLLGDVRYSGMASRLLSMFVGAAWAGSRAEAATAVKAVEAALDQLTQRAVQREQASAGKRAAAEAAVAVAEAELDALPADGGQLEEIRAAVSRVGQLSAEVAALRVQLNDLRGVKQEVHRQLKEEEARKHALLEDALGRRFFNALRPTACPRCAAPVTEERRAQEADGHGCSVCTTDLDLEAFDEEVLIATSAPEAERDAALRSTALLDVDSIDGKDAPAEGEAALRRALEDAIARANQVEAQLRERSRELDAAAAIARSGEELADLLQRKRDAELALAHAQGALSVLEMSPAADEATERETLDRKRVVLRIAEKVTAGWVQDAQRGQLTALSEQIAALARDFGIPQLTFVELAGNATLKVHKGGVDTTYSRCTPGEQLRLKVATAVALLRAGFASQIGRHPGLLTVDSPGSEEATTDSLDMMLHALEEAAAGSPDMQIIVATSRTELLEELIPEERRRVAPPGGYLW